MRRIPGQIPDAVGRLLKAGFLRTPPTWYAPVLANPPPTIAPLRQKQPAPAASPRRTPKGTMTTPKLKVKSIKYQEDAIRRHFFVDFPFEALRPTSLVELRNVAEEQVVDGKEWTLLAQRGAYPTVEDTIAFVVNLQNNPDARMSISEAYAKATSEFVQLRAEHEMKTMAAELEARHHGAEFKPTPFERYHKLEREALDAHTTQKSGNGQGGEAKISWKPPKKRRWTSHVDDQALPADDFTGGQRYVEKWRIPAAPAELADLASLNEAPERLSADKSTQRSEKESRDDDSVEVDDLTFLQQALGQSKTE